MIIIKIFIWFSQIPRFLLFFSTLDPLLENVSRRVLYFMSDLMTTTYLSLCSLGLCCIVSLLSFWLSGERKSGNGCERGDSVNMITYFWFTNLSILSLLSWCPFPARSPFQWYIPDNILLLLLIIGRLLTFTITSIMRKLPTASSTMRYEILKVSSMHLKSELYCF